MWVLRCNQFFATLWTVTHQVLLSLGFSRQEYWNRLLFPPLRDLLNPGINFCSCVASGFLLLSRWGRSNVTDTGSKYPSKDATNSKHLLGSYAKLRLISFYLISAMISSISGLETTTYVINSSYIFPLSPGSAHIGKNVHMFAPWAPQIHQLQTVLSTHPLVPANISHPCK